MSLTADYQQVADYEKLVQEYKARSDKYQELLASYRDAEQAGRQNPDLKAFLDKERAELHELYARVQDMRQKLAKAQEAALA
jgi:hypothetical protein